jgi:hypothetical protein
VQRTITAKRRDAVEKQDTMATGVFPHERGDTTVELSDDLLVCKDPDGRSSCRVALSKLEYAYLMIDNHGESSLFLYDEAWNTIPASSRGFRRVYERLSARFRFDDTVFFKHVGTRVALKKELWRKAHERTYDIVSGGHCDYREGFEIQSPEKCFVSWDTPLGELEKNGSVVFQNKPSGERYVRFNHPVRVGNIVVKSFLSYNGNGRPDAPILTYSALCYDTSQTDISYRELKSALTKDIGAIAEKSGYDRSDQRYSRFGLDGMDFQIVYTYDAEWSFNCGYATLTISNAREYPGLLYDAAYEDAMRVDASIVFDRPIRMPEDYRRERRVTRRAALLDRLFGDRSVIWVDNVNGKIGFSSGRYSRVYGKDEILSFTIQNWLPAKGGGMADLNIRSVHEEYAASVFSAPCNFFDAYADRIRSMTGKPLDFLPEASDC